MGSAGIYAMGNPLSSLEMWLAMAFGITAEDLSTANLACLLNAK
jgi:hypothetical protein